MLSSVAQPSPDAVAVAPVRVSIKVPDRPLEIALGSILERHYAPAVVRMPTWASSPHESASSGTTARV